MKDFEEYAISEQHYNWSAKAFGMAKNLLKLNIKLHDPNDLSNQGQIFLFNHFSRFETFIPQYLLYQSTGAYSRSIASPEFFNDDIFAQLLKSLGVVPSNLPRLFTFMAYEILHGRKLILFPEGGMVKDKRVLDAEGEYSIYSRMALERRKQHRGAAVIALAVDAFKTALLNYFSKGEYKLVEKWAKQLEFESLEGLMIQAIKPTLIVPANITFYPIRTDSNYLYRFAHKMNKNLSVRFSEELLIESNLLLKNTDMDIHFGDALNMNHYWRSWEKWILPFAVRQFKNLDHLFALQSDQFNFAEKIHITALQKRTLVVRNDYMENMYKAVSVHLSHIASQLIMLLYKQGIEDINRTQFHKMLYLCVKRIQKLDSLNLHRSLQNPKEYGVVIEGGSGRLKQFLYTIKKHNLLTIKADNYVFMPAILHDHDFDQIRTQNLISIYSNEIAPLSRVTKIIKTVAHQSKNVSSLEIAQLRYEDQLIAFEWDKAYYTKPQYEEINKLQTATEDPNWFFYKTEGASDVVILIHGLFASPAEMKPLAKHLTQLGYAVIGVRLKGHGTSPWDLKNTTWVDWFKSIIRGFNIAKAHYENIHVLGFSTGGLLALMLANTESNLKSATCICAPIEVKNKNLMFIPLIHKANKMVQWIKQSGLMPFIENTPENPQINYQHIPVRSLYQMKQLIHKIKSNKYLFDTPVHIMQGDQDPVVEPKSLDLLAEILPTDKTTKTILSSENHGVVYGNYDNAHQKISDWISSIE